MATIEKTTAQNSIQLSNPVDSHCQIPMRGNADHPQLRLLDKSNLVLAAGFVSPEKFNSLGTPGQRVQRLVGGLDHQPPKEKIQTDSKREEARKIFRGIYSDAIGAAQDRKNNLNFKEQKMIVSSDIGEMKKLASKAGIPEKDLQRYENNIHRELQNHKDGANHLNDRKPILPDSNNKIEEAKKTFRGFYSDAIGAAQDQKKNLNYKEQKMIVSSDIEEMKKLASKAGISEKDLQRYENNIHRELQNHNVNANQQVDRKLIKPDSKAELKVQELALHRREARGEYQELLKEAQGFTRSPYLKGSDREAFVSSNFDGMEKLSGPAGISKNRFEQDKKEVYQKVYYDHLHSASNYYKSHEIDDSIHPDIKLAEGIRQKAGISEEKFKKDVDRLKWLAEDNRRVFETAAEKNQGGQV